MSKSKVVGVLFLCVACSVFGQTNMAAFFRISSPSNAMITGFDPAAGTISWSNDVAGVTNQLQRSVDLTATNGWADYVMLVSTGATACTEHIMDLAPPAGMVLVPGGMNCGTNPDYSLIVSSFHMDRTEVTKAQWDVVYNWAVAHDYTFINSGQGKAANHPVHTVNWYDCVKWCNARSEMEGKTPCYTVSGSTYKTGETAPSCNFNANGYRLPTNYEWGYAARGGLNSKVFPWGNTISHSRANYYGRSGDFSYDYSDGFHPSYYTGGITPYTSPVGSFASNGYGLYDMSGNVWEWCWDSWGSYRYLRGGSWLYFAGDAAFGGRSVLPDAWDDQPGFRAVCR